MQAAKGIEFEFTAPYHWSWFPCQQFPQPPQFSPPPPWEASVPTLSGSSWLFTCRAVFPPFCIAINYLGLLDLC